MATLPGAWCYRVSTGTGRPGVSILWLGEVESLIGMATSISVWQHVKLSEQIRPWDTLACCWDVKQLTNQQTNSDLKIGTPVAALPCVWRYRAIAGTGVSTLWLGQMASLICNFCLSVAACTSHCELTLNVLYHTIPHQLCRSEVKDVHDLQSFVLTHSEESDSLLFILCFLWCMLLTCAFLKQNSAISLKKCVMVFKVFTTATRMLGVKQPRNNYCPFLNPHPFIYNEVVWLTAWFPLLNIFLL